MNRFDVEIWYRAALLCLSLICGALVSMWVNSLDRETSSSAVNTGQAAASGTIGVDVDARKLAVVRMLT